MIQYINFILAFITQKETGYLVYLFIIVIISMLIITMFNFQMISITKLFVVSFLCISYFSFNIYYKDYTTTFVTEFLVFTIFSIVVFNINVDINVRKISDYILYVSILSFPIFFNLDKLIIENEVSSSIPLSISYILLLGAINAIINAYYYFSKKTLNILGYSVNFLILLILLAYGNRGVLLTILILFLLLLSLKLKRKLSNRLIRFSLISFSTVILIGIVKYLNLNLLIQHSSSFMSILGLEISFLQKLTYLSNNNDISNGRIDLYLMTLESFYNNPIIGNGIGLFSYVNSTSLTYPHNFLLQILHDGGIIMLVVVIIFPLWIIVKNYEEIFTEKYIPLIMLLFVGSIPKLSLSADLWETNTFWILIGFIFFVSSRKEKAHVIKNSAQVNISK